MSTLAEVEDIIEDLKDSEDRDVCDLFCMEEGSDLREAVINTFVESIDNNSKPKVEELVLLLSNCKIFSTTRKTFVELMYFVNFSYDKDESKIFKFLNASIAIFNSFIYDLLIL